MTTGTSFTAPALTPYQITTLRRAAKILEKRLTYEDPTTIKSPSDMKTLLQCHLTGRLKEVFSVVFMDNRHRVIAIEDMFTGTIDTAAVYPREIIRGCLAHNAAAVTFAHNHPSGVAEPSDTDIRLTKKLQDACKTIDVRVLDHLIVGDGCITSLAERNMM